jgi:hypothetical protein
MGLKTALKMIAVHRNTQIRFCLDTVLNTILQKYDVEGTNATEYPILVRKALLTFKHQVVFDPATSKLR